MRVRSQGIHNTKTYEGACKLMAKQVTHPRLKSFCLFNFSSFNLNWQMVKQVLQFLNIFNFPFQPKHCSLLGKG